MKRSSTIFLAALMIVSMTATLASCGGNGDTTTAGGTTDAPKSTTKNPGVTNPPETSDGPDTGFSYVEPTVLIAADSEFSYKVFSAPYSATGPNGTYDEAADELAAYMAGYAWEMGADKIPESALTDIRAYTDKANGPFGDANGVEGLGYTNTDIGWSGDNHGLICRATFNIENLEQFKKDYKDLVLTMWYDNTPSIYLNGTLLFYMNTDLTGNPGDWVDAFNDIDPYGSHSDYLTDAAATMMDLLVEGENDIIIVLKDAWGGRECCFELATSDEPYYSDAE